MTLVKRNGNEPKTALPNLLDNIFNKDLFDMIETKGQYGSLPGVNVIESKEDYKIEVAAPGLTKEQFKVDLNKNVLTISAEVENKSENENERYTRREFNYQSFRRSFTLPQSADSEKINAKYENGILLIHVPKKEEAKEKPARRINIS